jgi:tRNA threonylcarbamoyladenosine biosynthesis protein TsaB
MKKPVRILGIDSATSMGSVGITDGGRIVAERSGYAIDGHGRFLAPLIERVLADGGCRFDDLDAVAVSIGPGSFTGLRIGLALAKGLSYAARRPLIPVPTLDALAAVADADAGEVVCPMLDARKGEVYTALYAVGAEGEMHCVTSVMLGRPAEVLARIDGRCRVLGDAVGGHESEILAALGTRALVLPFSHYHPRGAVVARLGAGLVPVEHGEGLARLEPLYVRPAYVQMDGAAG